jgi:protein phosphatase
MLLSKASERGSSAQTQAQRYVWALGELAAKIPKGQTIANRYRVVAPQIWLDTQPDLPPDFPPESDPEVLPYLQLLPWQLHVPEAFGICRWTDAVDGAQVLLLENAPIDLNGNLCPSLSESWSSAAPGRQAYWLWQLLQLWSPLVERGMAASLLDESNIRVQGGRVRLRELQPSAFEQSLRDLGYLWSTWAESAHRSIAEPLKAICQQMRVEEPLSQISDRLNQLMLSQVAQQPLRVSVAGATDTGPSRSQNEDTCFPTAEDLRDRDNPLNKALIPYVAIVCDGVGGHEGGEVASTMAVQMLKLQLSNFLKEVSREHHLLAPNAVAEQLTAIVRVVNNAIAAQNDAQERELRQRMGTTLVMALQLPQLVRTDAGEAFENSRELYIVNVGDSRAYWITPNSCQRLTLDDDLATREMQQGRYVYHQALGQPSAGALTQALGTREGERLRPTVGRFIVEEDGVLMLCSDGLSDNGWVEQSWAQIAPILFDEERSLWDGVDAWIQLANEYNGHDNTSVVLSYYRVSPMSQKEVKLFDSRRTAEVLNPPTADLSESSKHLLYAESAGLDPKPVSRRRRGTPPMWVTVAGVAAALALTAGIGWLALSQLKPQPQPQPQPQPSNPTVPPPAPTTPVEPQPGF